MGKKLADAGSGDEASQGAGNSTANRVHCSHYSRDIPHLEQLLREIISSTHPPSCEHCPPEGSAAAEAKAADTSDLWVCLDCGRRFCGGLLWDAIPYGHARRHARKDRHSWLARCDKPTIVYCVSCKNEVPIEMPIVDITAATTPPPAGSSSPLR